MGLGCSFTIEVGCGGACHEHCNILVCGNLLMAAMVNHSSNNQREHTSANETCHTSHDSDRRTGISAGSIGCSVCGDSGRDNKIGRGFQSIGQDDCTREIRVSKSKHNLLGDGGQTSKGDRDGGSDNCIGRSVTSDRNGISRHGEVRMVGIHILGRENRSRDGTTIGRNRDGRNGRGANGWSTSIGSQFNTKDDVLTINEIGGGDLGNEIFNLSIRGHGTSGTNLLDSLRTSIASSQRICLRVGTIVTSTVERRATFHIEVESQGAIESTIIVSTGRYDISFKELDTDASSRDISTSEAVGVGVVLIERIGKVRGIEVGGVTEADRGLRNIIRILDSGQ